MLNHDIEPDVGLDLTEDVSVCTGRDALDRGFYLREWLEKVDYTLADAHLLPLLVDIHVARVEEVDLAVSVVFF